MPITKIRGVLQIKGDSVGSTEIQDDSILGVDIAPNAITGDRVAPRSLDGTDIALGTITVDEIDAASIAGQGLVENGTTGELDVNVDGTTLVITADVVGVNPNLVTLNSNFVDLENVAGVKDGANTAFSLAYAPFPATSLHLFWNGVLQQEGAGNDYTLSGQNLTLAFAPKADDELKATYRKI